MPLTLNLEAYKAQTVNPTPHKNKKGGWPRNSSELARALSLRLPSRGGGCRLQT